jgi:outer membrane immunogenic protein
MIVRPVGRVRFDQQRTREIDGIGHKQPPALQKMLAPLDLSRFAVVCPGGHSISPATMLVSGRRDGINDVKKNQRGRMKRLMLASVTLLALARMDAALAGDVPPAVIYPASTPPGVVYPAPAPTGVIYPVPAPAFTFTGFYVGSTVGGALGSSKYREAPSGNFALFEPISGNTVSIPVQNVAAVGTSSTAPRGVIGGAEFGYNWQMGHFVLGLETDFSGWDLSSSAGVQGAGYPSIAVPQPPAPCKTKLTGKPPNERCLPVPGTAFTSTTSTSSNWLFTARPRLGFANGNQLIYLTGGLAVSDVSFAQSIVLTGYGQRPGSGPALAGATSSTQAGWTAGFGIEYALSWNWLIKAEYLYVSFPNHSAAQALSGAPATATGNLTGTAAGNLTDSIARAGFDYRF